MNLAEITSIAVALAMDCLSISIIAGYNNRRIDLLKMGTLVICCAVFQAMFFAAGFFASSSVVGYIGVAGRILSLTFLYVLGFKMIGNNFKKSQVQEPMLCLTIRMAIILGMAASLDALAVGATNGCQFNSTLYGVGADSFIIGSVSGVFSAIGLVIGLRIQRLITLPTSMVGGVILILISIKLTKGLIEHIYQMDINPIL